MRGRASRLGGVTERVPHGMCLDDLRAAQVLQGGWGESGMGDIPCGALSAKQDGQENLKQGLAEKFTDSPWRIQNHPDVREALSLSPPSISHQHGQACLLPRGKTSGVEETGQVRKSTELHSGVKEAWD